MNLSRSPHIITIDEPSQTSTRIELYLWNTGSQPLDPQYTLSKKIPSSNNTATYYNISPYTQEYYRFTTFQNIYNVYDQAISTNFVVQYVVEKFKTVGGVESPAGTESGEFMNGYGYYMEGQNPLNFTTVGLDEGTYLYNYDSSIAASQANAMAGTIDVFFSDSNFFIRYTNLRTNVQTDIPFSTTGVRTFPRVHDTNLADGNKVELIRGSSVRWTGTFKPQCEVKYQPVVVDFINKYGSWARIFFQKAKKRNINVKTDNYKVNPSSLPYSPTAEAQVREFNTTGTETIKLNTGWVNDGYAEYLQQLLLSEKVTLLDFETDTQYTPVNVKSKSLEKQTGLNNGMMNYSLEFEFAFDIINNVV